MPGAQGWDDQWVACNASLGRERGSEGAGGAAWWRFDCDLVDAEGAPLEERTAHHCSESFLGPQCVRKGLARGGGVAGARSECRRGCAMTLPRYRDPPPCIHSVPCRLVSVVDRVQGGFIGQTLSKFGIAGLYTVSHPSDFLGWHCLVQDGGVMSPVSLSIVQSSHR